MALILCLQGLSRFLIWKSFYDAVEHSLAPFFTNQTYNNATEFLNILTEDLTVFQEKFRGTEFVDFYNYTQDLADISRLNFSNHHGEQKAINLTTVILDSAIDYIFHVFQITVPEKISNKKAITQALIDGVRVFTTAFFYFIIGSGFVLLLLGVLYWFGKRHKSRYEWASLVLRFVSGIALALVVLTIYQNEVVVSDGIRISTDQAAFILDKQWVIPIVLLVFATGQSTPLIVKVFLHSCTPVVRHGADIFSLSHLAGRHSHLAGMETIRGDEGRRGMGRRGPTRSAWPSGEHLSSSESASRVWGIIKFTQTFCRGLVALRSSDGETQVHRLPH